MGEQEEKEKSEQKNPKKITTRRNYQGLSGIILETEGSVRKIKKALFYHKRVKKGTPNLTSPYVNSLFTIVLIK